MIRQGREPGLAGGDLGEPDQEEGEPAEQDVGADGGLMAVVDGPYVEGRLPVPPGPLDREELLVPPGHLFRAQRRVAAPEQELAVEATGPRRRGRPRRGCGRRRYDRASCPRADDPHRPSPRMDRPSSRRSCRRPPSRATSRGRRHRRPPRAHPVCLLPAGRQQPLRSRKGWYYSVRMLSASTASSATGMPRQAGCSRLSMSTCARR